MFHKVLYLAPSYSYYIQTISLTRSSQSCSQMTLFIIFGEDVTYLTRCLNHDLSQLNDWLKANKLSLNANKTNYIVFNNSAAALPQDNEDICLIIGSDKLEQFDLILLNVLRPLFCALTLG